MMKVLVVEDEARSRRGLVNLIQRNYSDYIVMEEANGKEALRRLLTSPVDIVITDIRMPHMDGLELIGWLRAKEIDTVIIILTAYAQFDYAQRAVRLGAFDYVTKPVDTDKFLDILSLAEKQVIVNRNRHRGASDGSPKSMEQALYRLIKAEAQPTDMRLLLEYMVEREFRQRAWILVTKFGRNAEDSILEKTEMEALNQRWDKEALMPWGSITFSLDDDSDVRISLLFPAGEIEAESERQLAEFWFAKLGGLADYGLAMPLTGVSEELELTPEGLQKAYKQARRALWYHFYMGKESLLFHSQLHSSSEVLSHNTYKLEEELKGYIRMLDEDKAIERFQFMYKKMHNGGREEPDLFKEMLLHVMMNVSNVLQDFLPAAEGNRWMERLRTELATSVHTEQLSSRAEQHLRELLQTLRLLKDNRNERIVHRCIQYIEEHFAEELSLEWMAEKFHFHTSYFSKLIKLHSGLSFSKYVTHLRINRARELLVTTNDKVYEIAARVGFSDVKYFIRVYKKETGVAPDEYRKMYVAT